MAEEEVCLLLLPATPDDDDVDKETLEVLFDADVEDEEDGAVVSTPRAEAVLLLLLTDAVAGRASAATGREDAGTEDDPGPYLFASTATAALLGSLRSF